MIKVKRVDHIGILVKGVEQTLPFYNLLGLQLSASEDLSERGVKLAFLPAGESQLELVAPTRPDSSASQKLAERGECIDHICFAVEDIDGALQELMAAGVRMIDETPRTGHAGHRIAFIHPDSAHGIRVELLED